MMEKNMNQYANQNQKRCCNQNKIATRLMAVAMAGCLLPLLAGCSDTQEPVEVSGLPMPIEIQTASIAGEVETRASDEKALEQGAIGLYRTTDNTYAALTNIPYSYTDGKWTSADATDNTKTIFVDHRSATLYGYYPYSASPNATGTVFNLNQKRYTEADALFYTGNMTGISNRNTALKMQLKPAYSRLTIRLKNYNLPDCVISSMTIAPGSGTFTTDGTIDIHAANPTVTKGSSTIASYEFPFVTSGDKADSIAVKGIGTGQWDETMDVLWIPQTLSGNMKITIHLHFSGENVISTPSVDNTLSVTIPSLSLSALTQGTQHIIPLLVKGTTIGGNVSVPTLVVEEEYDPFEEKKLTSYTLPPVTVNGVHVATGNVFYYSHEVLLQNWYTFSGKAGGTFGKSPVQNFTFATVTSSDPCQEVGPNWHTPTEQQLKTIMNARTGSYGSLSDRGTTGNGWYVGVANSDTGVFFAVGNYLSSGGGYLSVTSAGMSYVTSAGSSSYMIRCVSDIKY